MSKFSGVLSTRQNSGELATQKAKIPKVRKSETAKVSASAPAAESPKRGRPPGKRSSSEYRQITAYVRADTHKAVRHKLIDDGRELSELIEDLLAAWARP